MTVQAELRSKCSIIERLFAWLGNFRRLVVRYERHALNYLGFIRLDCILSLLRQGYMT